MGSHETWVLGLGETLHCLEAELVMFLPRGPFLLCACLT